MPLNVWYNGDTKKKDRRSDNYSAYGKQLNREELSTWTILT